jgi:hypothetical protein
MIFFLADFKKKLKRLFTSKIIRCYLVLMGVFLGYLLLPSLAVPQIGERFPSETGFTSDLLGPPTGTYFTNLEKDDVVSFYLNSYSRSSFLNLPLPAKVIEHQPEYAGEIINDMHTAKNTSFLVEINQPFRESLIIKGYGEVSQIEREEKEAKQIKKFEPQKGEVYFLKLDLYQVKPAIGPRIVSWLVYLIIVPLVLTFFWQRIKEAGIAIGKIFRK